MKRRGGVVAWLTLAGLSRRWQAVVYASVGAVLGTALLVARAANAASYLSDRPETCINCHVMTDAYVSWQRGSHGRVAVCVDCHLPHDNVIAKTAFKATSGMKDSYLFLRGLARQVPRLSPGTVRVVRQNCLRCHGDQLAMVRMAGSAERPCWDCHSNIHGEVRSLSASPEVLRPRLPHAGLRWMKEGVLP